MSTTLQDAPFRLAEHPTELQMLSKYFRALGDPTRLEILRLIDGRERSVNELVAALNTEQPRVSNHLAVLRWAQFVKTRREHRTIYYTVADPRVTQLVKIASELLAQNEDHQAAIR
jgi:DNA-binding transcriptional ArsR family regulator